MFARHRRFLLAFLLGAALGLGAIALGQPPGRAGLIAANGFFATYLVLMAVYIHGMTPSDLRRHADLSDEGVPLIAALALGSVVLSLTAIAFSLQQASGTEAALAVASVPLGWSMLHVLAAFHYAALWYGGNARGLAFPGNAAPDAWDFLYFSFTIGMTAQVSDVVVERPALRRLVLGHGIVSFFYNTVILAFAVNAALR
ncbi:MAG: DUF1345 domain-containing protein [Gemmobacter sp.]|nr:DUF1345 domain-containing protein [Gemmobacter sp.]